MALSRRELLELGIGSVTVLGCALVKTATAQTSDDQPPPTQTVAEVPVIWLATGSCTGCSVAMINTVAPAVNELLLGEVVPGMHLSLRFHTTVMAAAGEPALAAIDEVQRNHKGNYVLIVDGATATAADGAYCIMGESESGPITGYQQVRDLGRDALLVLAVGACASSGGIPAASPNPTDAISIGELFKREAIATPLVNIPGCPPHPDWIIGTIVMVLLGGLDAVELDDQKRPTAFFGQCIHDNCPYRGHFERGEFAGQFGEHGCLLKLGCKGPITFADCPIRKFNHGTSWCCEAGHPCIGCCHPDFPFEQSMFAPVQPVSLDYPAMYPPTLDTTARRSTDADTYTTIGLIGVGAFLAGVGVATAAKRLKAEPAEADDVTANNEPDKLEAGDG